VKRNSLTLIIVGLLLTSCGLIERYTTPQDSSASSENIPASGEVATDTPAKQTDEFDMLSSQVDAPPAESVPTVSDNSVEATKTYDTPPPMEAMPEVMPEVKPETIAVEDGPRKIKIYKVKKGETLMQIAFKLYGDINRWSDLKKLNQEKVSRDKTLATNMSIKYEAPETEFVWNPVGEPYLINNGETLGVISNNVYQTPKKWKSIWENNKPLIKNPNIIYAGFTLYYIKGEALANYVQPKKMNKVKKEAPVKEAAAVEKIDVADEIQKPDTVDTTETATRDTASDEDITNF
jgi:nucleoid-associated protein YgaU